LAFAGAPEVLEVAAFFVFSFESAFPTALLAGLIVFLTVVFLAGSLLASFGFFVADALVFDADVFFDVERADVFEEDFEAEVDLVFGVGRN